jgi:hypothetical protein
MASGSGTYEPVAIVQLLADRERGTVLGTEQSYGPNVASWREI